MMKIMDKYYTVARLFPTLITAVPLILIYWFFVRPLILPLLSDLWYLIFIGDATIFMAFTFLLVQFNRNLSKNIFQNFFF